jgi:hypothetical protein
MRFEKGSGATAGFGLVVAVAMILFRPFQCEFEPKQAAEERRQFEGQFAAERNF